MVRLSKIQVLDNLRKERAKRNRPFLQRPCCNDVNAKVERFKEKQKIRKRRKDRLRNERIRT